jgi:chromosome segregation ATPase
MTRRALLVAGLALAGCAVTAPAPPPDPLRIADQEMAAARYREAAQLYEEFLRASPQHPAAERARAAHGALVALAAAQGERDRLRADLAARDAEIARLRQDLGARATESAGRTAEVSRLRRDLDARQAEIDRLRADLDRLRSIDLRREPSRR